MQFFLWPLCLFFDIRILITPLVPQALLNNNMTGHISGTGIVKILRAPKFIPIFSNVRVAHSVYLCADFLVVSISSTGH